MSDQNKKNGEQINKKKHEVDAIWLFLEASLNMAVAGLKLSENLTTKSKMIDGVKNKVFLLQPNQQQYKFYLGNFSIDKLEKEKIANISNEVKAAYRLSTGYVNWKNTWDISDIKETINSSTREINPFKNKSKAFRYEINESKIGSLKHFNFEIFVIKRCCVCGAEDSFNNRLVYCQNDKNFFCSNCDKAWHEQKEKMSLNLHLRNANYKYTLAYFGNCTIEGHFNKPFEYFDIINKQCLCVKCVELFLNNPDKINKEIFFIEDYLKVKKIDEDFLNSRIDSICEEINHRLFYAEDVWKKIDKYEKEYCQELYDDKKDNIKRMREEGFSRQTFLCCIFMEIQRIIKEIDSKIIFIKNQRNNVDVSTFLYMNQIFQIYMNELIRNLDYLGTSNFEISTKNIITISEYKDEKKFEPLKLEPFIDVNQDDYILNDS